MSVCVWLDAISLFGDLVTFLITFGTLEELTGGTLHFEEMNQTRPKVSSKVTK